MDNQKIETHIICACMGVTQADIDQARAAGSQTFEALQETLLVGTGCGGSKHHVQTLLQDKGG